MVYRFLRDAFGVFVLPVLEHCSAVWCPAAYTHLTLLDRAVSGSRFLTGGVLECDIAHLRSDSTVYAGEDHGVTLYILFMVLSLCRMCQCGLHAVLWSHIGILLRILPAEPYSTEGPLFPSQCLCGTILLTLYTMAWDCMAGFKSRAIAFSLA